MGPVRHARQRLGVVRRLVREVLRSTSDRSDRAFRRHRPRLSRRQRRVFGDLQPIRKSNRDESVLEGLRQLSRRHGRSDSEIDLVTFSHCRAEAGRGG
jgi:hypothetical protein